MKRLSSEGLRVKLSVKDLFFDADRVLVAVDRARRRNLARVGHWIMKDARWSLRPWRRKRVAEMRPEERKQYRRRVHIAKAKGRPRPKRSWAASRAPDPPRVRSASMLKRRLYFSWDEVTDSTVIGPEATARAVVPRLLEEGGLARTSQFVYALTKVGAYVMEPRPYMGPALRRAIPRMSRIWRDSVKSTV